MTDKLSDKFQNIRRKNIDSFLSHVKSAVADDKSITISRPKLNIVDLSSTLQCFATDKFDIHSYIDDYYTSKSIKKSVEHKTELLQRKQLLTTKLKDVVSDNYLYVISASNSINLLSSDIVKINTYMQTYNKILNNISNNIKLFSTSTVNENNTNIHANIDNNLRNNDSNDNEQIHETYHLLDELDSATLCRQFEKAIELYHSIKAKCETLSKNSVNNYNEVDALFASKVNDLLESLLSDLSTLSPNDRDYMSVTHLIAQLGAIDRTVNSFLHYQSLSLKGRIRKLKIVTGDVISYLNDFVSILCSHILTTCSLFTSLFSSIDTSLNSSLSTWIFDELEIWINMVMSYLFNQPEISLSEISTCLNSLFKAFVPLQNNGIFVSFFLTKLISSHLLEAIQNAFKLKQSFFSTITGDNWEPISFAGRLKNNKIHITKSCTVLDSIIIELYQHMQNLFTIEIPLELQLICYTPIIQNVIRMLTQYLTFITNAEKNSSESFHDSQRIAIIANIFYLQGDLMPFLTSQLEKLFGRPCSELQSFTKKLLLLYEQVLISFCKGRSSYIVDNILHKNQQKTEALDKNFSLPESHLSKFLSLFEYLSSLKIFFDKNIGGNEISSFLNKLFNDIFRNIESSDYKFPIEEIETLISIGSGYITSETTTFINSKLIKPDNTHVSKTPIIGRKLKEIVVEHNEKS